MSSYGDEVRNLPELLAKHWGPDKFFRDAKISRLTAAGDNYGSTMLKIDVRVVVRRTGMEETLHTVAKILPESEFFRKIFHVETSALAEMNFYNIIVPTLREFQKDLGIKHVIDCFGECYANRKTLREDSDVIDDDSVIIFENLKAIGFGNIDRQTGFDLNTAKLVLKDLAIFHAVPLALKILRPSVFAEKVKAYCAEMHKSNEEAGPSDDILTAVLKEKEDITSKALELLSKKNTTPSPPREPFATLIHNDMWTNNTMQKFVDGKAVANKLIDFQGYTYGSPASDIFFFLWSSVSKNVLEENLDNLLRYYHECFIATLEEHGCDVSPFGYETFLEEIRLTAKAEFGKCLFFILLVIYAKKQDEPASEDGMPAWEKMQGDIPMVAKEKVWFMAAECDKRGWLE